eukprot:m.282195 g.282195  ORF g.282195 m.282195 type:complete len:159 (+) comp40652_c1_seq10:1195-1671(+)
MGKVGLIWAIMQAKIPSISPDLNFAFSENNKEVCVGKTASVNAGVNCGICLSTNSILGNESGILFDSWMSRYSSKARLFGSWLMKASLSELDIFSKMEHNVKKVNFKVKDDTYPWFAIDGERFDGREITVTFCPQMVNFFCCLSERSHEQIPAVEKVP